MGSMGTAGARCESRGHHKSHMHPHKPRAAYLEQQPDSEVQLLHLEQMSTTTTTTTHSFPTTSTQRRCLQATFTPLLPQQCPRDVPHPQAAQTAHTRHTHTRHTHIPHTHTFKSGTLVPFSPFRAKPSTRSRTLTSLSLTRM